MREAIVNYGRNARSPASSGISQGAPLCPVVGRCLAAVERHPDAATPSPSQIFQQFDKAPYRLESVDVVSNGEIFTDSGFTANSRSTQTLVNPGSTDAKPNLRKIGDPTELINVVASTGRYDGSEIDVPSVRSPD